MRSLMRLLLILLLGQSAAALDQFLMVAQG
jgi:hypothetical protein